VVPQVGGTVQRAYLCRQYAAMIQSMDDRSNHDLSEAGAKRVEISKRHGHVYLLSVCTCDEG
jgi:hypothetical protein